MFPACTNMAIEGINILVPFEDNILKGNSLNAVFSNPNELKALLTIMNGKIIDNGEI